VIEALTNGLPSLVSEAMQAARVSLWLRPDLRPRETVWQYSANFACYDFCAGSSLRGSLTGHLIGRLSCGKKRPASHLAGPFLESLGGI
jgi:hypothetical protein